VAVASLCLTVFVLTFAFSKYWVTKQGFVTSLLDFTFMIDSYTRMAFELTPPLPTERDIESAIERLRPTAHREVKHRVVWWFGQWGEAAVRQLTPAFESADERRKEWLARALGETRSPQAVAPLVRYLASRSQSEDLSSWHH
jgi:HEAT repeat protein